MFNLDKKFASVKLVADVIKTFGSAFDVLSKNILQNKQDIEDLKARVKLLEMKGKQWKK